MYPCHSYIKSVRFKFERYKALGDKTFEQHSEEYIYGTLNAEENSIALIVKYLTGNMRSR